MVTELDKNTALVLIDLQNGIVSLPVAHPVKDILAKSAELLAAFRKASLPVVIVNVNPTGSAFSKTRKEPAGGSHQFKADWLDIVPEIQTEPTDIFITKTTWGAFFNTELDVQLKAKGVTGIVLAGIATSIGVEATARTAGELGYNVTFATDAVTDMFLEAHERSLKYIFPRIGEVDVTEKIVDLLG